MDANSAVQLIVTAIILGTAETASQVVKDIYSGLKSLLLDRYKIRSDELDQLELNQDDNERHNIAEGIGQQLIAQQANVDDELIKNAHNLLAIVDKGIDIPLLSRPEIDELVDIFIRSGRAKYPAREATCNRIGFPYDETSQASTDRDWASLFVDQRVSGKQRLPLILLCRELAQFVGGDLKVTLGRIANHLQQL
jgi:hypothetical protein